MKPKHASGKAASREKRVDCNNNRNNVVVCYALDEVRTRQILREKADCKQSKFCTTFVFHFSWVLQPSQEKIIENNAYAKFWGQIRCVMGNVEVAYRSLLHIHVDPVVDSCCSQLTAVKTG